MSYLNSTRSIILSAAVIAGVYAGTVLADDAKRVPTTTYSMGPGRIEYIGGQTKNCVVLMKDIALSETHSTEDALIVYEDGSVTDDLYETTVDSTHKGVMKNSKGDKIADVELYIQGNGAKSLRYKESRPNGTTQFSYQNTATDGSQLAFDEVFDKSGTRIAQMSGEARPISKETYEILIKKLTAH